MIDKCGFERRACVNSGLLVTLCEFHGYAAKLEHYDKKLGIRDAQSLLMLLLCSKFMARSLSDGILARRWDCVRTEVIPALGLDAEIQQKIISYLEKEWLCEAWGSTWIDKGRHNADRTIAFILRHLAKTNNSQERVWLTYLAEVCRYVMFKRRDFEFNGITNAYGNRRSCLIDVLALTRRDYPNRRTRIATPVQNTVLLAHAIVIQKGVMAGPGQFVYVRKGLSPLRILHFGSHEPKSPDIRLPRKHALATKPMRDLLCKELAEQGCDMKDGFEVYNPETWQCTHSGQYMRLKTPSFCPSFQGRCVHI